jgi:thioredoxin 1
MSAEVNKDNFQEEVVEPGVPTVVDFWGPRCKACLALNPVVDKLAEEYQGRFRLIKIDASKHRRLCINLRLLSLPTFIFYRDGEEKNRLFGEQVSPQDLKEAVTALYSPEA